MDLVFTYLFITLVVILTSIVVPVMDLVEQRPNFIAITTKLQCALLMGAAQSCSKLIVCLPIYTLLVRYGMA
jgi:hypothetical protein